MSLQKEFSMIKRILVADDDADDRLMFEDVFAGDAPALAAATSIAGPLTMLLNNDRETVTIESLELSHQIGRKQGGFSNGHGK